MKRSLWMMVLLVGTGTLLAAPADPPQPPANAPKEQAQTHRSRSRGRSPKMNPEEQQAMQKRRFEIMVLLHTYQMLPESDRAAVKAELEKRIAADLTAELARRKAKLAAFESGVAKLKQEIAEQEKDMDRAVAAELERLLKMPLPPPPAPGAEPPHDGMPGGPGRVGASGNPASERPEPPDHREPPERPENR